MTKLILIKTLEYYDVPQILVAADAIGTNYLCTLYKNDAESGYLYLGVQISEARLAAFEGGQFDLRDAYIHPEADSGFYLVAATNGGLNVVKPLQLQDITEEMLPEAGYTYNLAWTSNKLWLVLDYCDTTPLFICSQPFLLNNVYFMN